METPTRTISRGTPKQVAFFLTNRLMVNYQPTQTNEVQKLTTGTRYLIDAIDAYHQLTAYVSISVNEVINGAKEREQVLQDTAFNEACTAMEKALSNLLGRQIIGVRVWTDEEV